MTKVTEVNFFFEKSNLFRVIHADGLYGGVSPNGHLHFAFYSQRLPLPKTSKIQVGEDGTPSGPEVVTEKKDGFFRELEVDVVMDYSTALSTYIWLEEKIREMAALNGQSPEQIQAALESLRNSK